MWVYGVLILCVLLYINELLMTCCVGYIVITILVPYIINVVHTVCQYFNYIVWFQLSLSTVVKQILITVQNCFVQRECRKATEQKDVWQVGERQGGWVGGWVWYVGGGEYVSYVPIFKIAPKILLGKTVYH